MYRDDSGILSLVILCLGITNTSVQNFLRLNCTEVFVETKSFLIKFNPREGPGG